MGDMKTFLKEARKAIDSGEFDAAVEKCEAILRSDANNYMALILLGVALRDNERAESVFKKAIASKDTNPLAYQGLAKFYDSKNSPDHLKSLLKLYYRLSTIPGVNEAETFDNMYNVALKIDDCNACGSLINDFLSKEYNDVRKNRLIIMLSKVLANTNGAMDSGLLSLYKKVMSLSHEICDDLFVLKYLKCLLKVEGYKCLFDQIWEIAPHSLVMQEWICEIFARAFILNLHTNFIFDNLEPLIYNVIEERLNSEHGILALAVLKLIKKDKFNAFVVASDTTKFNRKNNIVCIFCAMCCIELGRYLEAENIIKAHVGDPDTDVALRSKRILLIAKSSQQISQKCIEAIKISEDLNPSSLTEVERVSLFNAYIHLEMFDKAKSCLETLTDSSEHPSLCAKLLKKTNKIEEAVDVLIMNENNHLCQLQLGKLHLEKKDYKNAFKYLLESARNDPYNFEIFLYLGDFYTLCGKNFEKAQKCYTKAFELNPECSKAGKNLSNTYVALEDWSSNLTFLKSLTSLDMQVNENQTHWPWMQLGFHYLALEQWDTAIVHLRTYIRLNSSDVDAWETLADAYYHRGSYTSAMKCYKKAVELDPQKKYCLVQIGTVQCLLGFFRDALSTYETISDDSFLPALKGLAEVKICTANEMFSQNLYGLCRDQAQEAINLISPSLVKQNKLSCLWSTLSNAIMIILKLPPKYNWLLFDSDFLLNNEKSGLKKKYEGKEIYSLAISCISKTISLSVGSNSYLYHELATVYLAFYEYSNDVIHAEKSYAAIEKCIEMEKTRWQHWNLLGIICISKAINKRSIAQHAFIKALDLDPINSMVWSNLGVFYSIVGDNVLANQVFKKAQEANPTFIPSWVGQALIAESVGHHEAMDLFRHASQLGFHRESSLGYAYWVTNSMIELNKKTSSSLTYAIENMHAIPAACDLMAWYNEFEPKNACSWNIYGLLLEKMGCFRRAVEAFKNALNTVDKDNEDKVFSNLARNYYRLGKYDSAIELVKTITEISYKTACCLALYYFESGRYKDAYSTYADVVTNMVDNDKEKSDILIAMAEVSCKLEDHDGANTLLMQCFHLNDGTPHINVVVAFGAFQLLISDVEAAKNAVNELIAIKEGGLNQKLVTLESYYLLLRDGPFAAIKSVCNNIHYYPRMESLWKTVSRITNCDASLVYAAVTKCLSFNSVDNNDEYLKRVCLSELFLGNYHQCKMYALKAIRSRPDSAENWTLLISALLPRVQESNEVAFDEYQLTSLIECVLQQFTVTKPLNDWLTNALYTIVENRA